MAKLNFYRLPPTLRCGNCHQTVRAHGVSGYCPDGDGATVRFQHPDGEPVSFVPKAPRSATEP